MRVFSYTELKRVEQLVRVAQNLDPGENGPLGPPRWGPASWWRAGIAVLGILIAGLLVYRLFG